MSYWNHRVVRYPNTDTGQDIYELAEVYYDENGKVKGYGRPFLIGDTQEELQELADRLLRAVAKPPLDVIEGTEDYGNSKTVGRAEAQ